MLRNDNVTLVMAFVLAVDEGYIFTQLKEILLQNF